MNFKKFLYFILFGLILNLSFFFTVNSVKAESDDTLIDTMQKWIYDEGLIICSSSTLSTLDNNQGVFLKYNFSIDDDFYLKSFTFRQGLSGSWATNNIRYKLDIKDSTSTSANIICESISDTFNYSSTYTGTFKTFYFNQDYCELKKDTDYWFNIKSDIDDNCTYSTKLLNFGFSNYFTTEGDIDVWYYPSNTGTPTHRTDLTPIVFIQKYSDSETGVCGDCICSGGGGSSATTSTSTLINSQFLGGQDIGKISAISGTDETGITYTVYSYPNLLFRFILAILVLGVSVSCLLIFFKTKK